MFLNNFQFVICYTPPTAGQHYDTYKVTEHDGLLGFFLLIVLLSSPFIHAYYRDKREKERRKRDKEIKNRP